MQNFENQWKSMKIDRNRWKSCFLNHFLKPLFTKWTIFLKNGTQNGVKIHFKPGSARNRKEQEKGEGWRRSRNRIGSRTKQVPYRTVPYRTVPYRKPQPASQQASMELIYCLRNWSRGRFGVVFGIILGSLFDVFEMSLAPLSNETPDSERQRRKTYRQARKKRAQI